MKAIDQLQMFEPEGSKLVQLASDHLRSANHAARSALLLLECGYSSAAKSVAAQSRSLLEAAAVCETALQFEQLAGLS